MREKEFLPLVESKLGIAKLNPMQTEMLQAAHSGRDITLIAPTGSGKTLAFALPVLRQLTPPSGRVQCVVIAPSRELVLQIAGVLRAIAKGYKVTALYGGHNVEDEVNSLGVTPDIVVATPGRLLDHIRRRNIDVLPSRILVLDEFDKSLELGFADEMERIIKHMKNVSRRILTSATPMTEIPDFVRLSEPMTIDRRESDSEMRPHLTVYRVLSEQKDKLEALHMLLCSLAEKTDGKIERTIVFVNHRESAERVATWLAKAGVDAVLYHGALPQMDREKAITMFNNGSRPVLVATDLAARGLDIEGVENVIHYHLPLTPETYTHRNGRTARAGAEGNVFLLTGPDEKLPDYAEIDAGFDMGKSCRPLRSGLTTLYISAGKKEKVSKGDIVGFLTGQGELAGTDIGRINVFDHYSLVTVPTAEADALCRRLSPHKLKGERRKITPAR